MKMSYFVLGTNDMTAATKFYDALFAQSGIASAMPTERMTYWVGKTFAFAIARPFNEQPASHGNGTMLGLDTGSEDEVRRLHKLAIELGGRCDGEPGQRGPFYSCYVRDLDENKLCLFTQ
ncbi:VOC family protein [Maricaulis sp.]|uniref:VOC family protein n=1 Tax=Maricaulis sp. TaxID=1486257 RepID=UPI0025C275FE|nr:VOC family protein [Maricaulis sp.]